MTALLSLFFVLSLLQFARAWTLVGSYSFWDFKTEPQFRIPIITATTNSLNNSRAYPGYIFLDPETIKPAPHKKGKGKRIQHSLGPLIYDHLGRPVWSGEVLDDNSRTENTHVCKYKGEDALCYTRSNPPATNYILNSHYEKVFERKTTYKGRLMLNQHDFQTVNDGTAVLQPYNNRTWDDLRVIGSRRWGGIRDGCFEELSLTGELIFRFCPKGMWPYEHSETLNITEVPDWGPRHYWDYLHFNSIDKNEEGDYLFSARHFSQIVKVAGPNSQFPGRVLWRLGGRTSNFTFEDRMFPFKLQHDARFVSTSATETIVTVHDNSGSTDLNGNIIEAEKCSGKMIKLNNETMKAEIVKIFYHPAHNHECPRVGSARVLPNGNALVGFGGLPHFAEYSSDDKPELLYMATLMNPDNERPTANYRSLKSPWVGRPKTTPKIVAYSQCCVGKPFVAYVSWNGATEVTHWRFQYKDQEGKWLGGGTHERDGFETRVFLSAGLGQKVVPQTVHVVALDKNGTVLGSARNSTFVPSKKAIDEYGCDIAGCRKFFPFDKQYNIAWSCEGIPYTSLLGVVFVVVVIEFLARFGDGMMYNLAGAGKISLPYKPGYVSLENNAALAHPDDFKDP